MFKKVFFFSFFLGFATNNASCNPTPQVQLSQKVINKRVAELEILLKTINNNGNGKNTLDDANNMREVVYQLLKPFQYRLGKHIAIIITKSLISELSDKYTNGLIDSFGNVLTGHKREIDYKPFLCKILGTKITAGFIDSFDSNYLAQIQADITTEVLLVLTEYCKKHSQGYFLEKSSSTITSELNNISNNLPSLIQCIFDCIIKFATQVPLDLFNTLKKDPTAGFCTIFWFAASSIISANQSKHSAELQSISMADSIKTCAEVGDIVANIGTVQAFTGEEFEQNRLRSFIEKTKVSLKNTRDYLFRSENIQNINSTAYRGFMLYKAADRVQKRINKKKTNIEISDIKDSLSLSNSITSNIKWAPHIYGWFTQCWNSVAQGLKVILQPHTVVDKPNAPKLNVSSGKITFKNVIFKYGESDDQEFSCNFEINPGEKIGIVGASGGGKTTLTNLLLRFYDISGGEILIDGQNIANVTQKSLRKNIALVSQNTPLFNRTLFENIRYGNNLATDKEVFAAAEKACIHNFCSTLPQGYETLVGERGARLSGGQKQRIAIARAVLKDAPILILDEATSALDSITEASIKNELDNLMKNKTTLIIAHRLSTIRNVDRIIVCDSGKVIDQGTHDQLLERCNTYKQLWNSQETQT